jgi:hypothetical protein
VAVAAGEFTHDGVALKASLRLVDREAASLLQQMIGAGVVGQLQISLSHRAVQGGEGLCLRLIGFGRRHELDQPGRGLGGITHAHRQRPQRVQQPAGHVLPDAGQGHRRDAVGRDRAGVAEAGHRARIFRIDQGGAIAFALEKGGGADADDAGADDGDMGFGLALGLVIGHGSGLILLEHCAGRPGRRHLPGNLTRPPTRSEGMPWLGN